MFSQGDKVVYPGHGVARVRRVLEKMVAGKTSQFFELELLKKEMVVLVPIENAREVGIRRLSTRKGIEDVLELVAQPVLLSSQDSYVMNWNKRNREYLGKIRSGNLLEIGEIYRNLKHISGHKELSFGEKNLLHQTELLLAEEISIVNEVIPEFATQQLRSLVEQGE